MRYTVKQLAGIAGVTRRTLHFYDEKGLLVPSEVGENGYRYYDEAALLRLQQVLFYREMGLELDRIRAILDDPGFDALAALRSHRQTLAGNIQRMQTLIRTVDATIMHLIGEIDMDRKNIFEGFDEKKQKEYEQEAVDRWGDTARESINLWNSYSDEKKAAVMAEAGEIYESIAANMDKGAASPEVRAQLARWHENLRNFYEPTIETLGGLGAMYHDHPDFNATFTKIHPDLPAFLKEAIAIYVDELETQWLERELGILKE